MDYGVEHRKEKKNRLPTAVKNCFQLRSDKAYSLIALNVDVVQDSALFAKRKPNFGRGRNREYSRHPENSRGTRVQQNCKSPDKFQQTAARKSVQDKVGIVCYKCNQVGHVVSNCPLNRSNSKGDYRSADILDDLESANLSTKRNNQLCATMYQINNRMVPDYLIDLSLKQI